MASVFNLGEAFRTAEQVKSSRQRRQFLDAKADDLTAQRDNQQRITSLSQAFLGGDQEAGMQLAALDPQRATATREFQQGGQPEQPDMGAIRERVDTLDRLAETALRVPPESRQQYLMGQLRRLPSGPYVEAAMEAVERGEIDDQSLIRFREQELAPLKSMTDPETTEFDRDVAAYRAAGVDEERARMLASGRLELRTDPVSGATQIIDVGTAPVGQPIRGEGADDISVEPDTFENPIPQEGERSLAAGTGTLEQAVKGGANAAAQLLGADPIFPGQTTSSTAVTNLARDTALALASAADGRTSNLRYEAFLQTQAQPFTGEGTARARVRETIDQLSSRIQEFERFANDPAADRTLRRNAQNQIGNLRRLRQRWADLATGGPQQEQPEPDASGFRQTPGGTRYRPVE